MNALFRKALPLLFLGLPACGGDEDVTIYVSLDQEHSQRLVQMFEERSGLKVDAQYDAEAQKTVGWVTRIREEAENPIADVFWNNELAHTVALGQAGMLQPYESASAKGIPARYRSADNLWTGFAARARVLIVNTDKIPNPEDRPKSIWDLCDPKWKGKCAVARPTTGTTLTHFAALRLELGEEGFERWIQGLLDNDVAFLQSNGATMKQTSETDNDIWFALTDTDDFHVALTKGKPVACVFPDQEPAGGSDKALGTMLIPNSVAIIKGGPNREIASQLVDFILSEEVEGLLAAAKSAQIPVRASVAGPKEPQIRGIGSFTEMSWDPEAVARSLSTRMGEFQSRFGGSDPK